ncbi:MULTISPECIES: purine nucleoside phosphorylase YfiH [Tenebrionibacter/Tenebrionicola group]|jgi:YfiH family protein|uniref:Purine nucleoside phosphorylase n=2 Tax=Tenebrionibacter/Tenebrionicola group TaxID=2969848 RepID=A0A8K0Y0A1_9ENTR|nr:MULTISPECIES: purine nucleoside phosphorylase YfiH [Tenebrionibacter/Tenebrionicola group]MBK4716419.1 polyphenol oxidase [Tenebrionibacter intestinalis]MBV5097080.1 polyphenol oxidase [Tenebrionicola larvae]
MINLIVPQWPLPAGVGACSSTRSGGVSVAPWDSMNLGAHCGDNTTHVEENRRRFYEAAGLPSQPVWLEQVHGTTVLSLNDKPPLSKRADASYTNKRGVVSAVMTADCLPVLFCNIAGTEVAAAHAGWRGLCGGVLENTIACFRDSPENIMAWLGPAIGPGAFEVGSEVREAFIEKEAKSSAAFCPAGKKYYADIYLLARQRLSNLGVCQIYGGERCTFSEKEEFFSYRRDRITGRMASFIWLI